MLKTPFNGLNGPFTFSTVNTGDNSASDILSLAQAKTFMRVEGNDEDDLIESMIEESIQFVEEQYGFQLVTKTVTVEYEFFGKEVNLPLYPATSVTSVKTIQPDGSEHTLTVNEDYYKTGDKLVFDNVYGWEIPEDRVRLKIVYTAGYQSIPSGIILGLKKLVASNFEDRQDAVDGSVSMLPNNSKQHFKRYARL